MRTATRGDFDAWLDLAREVEPLFGPMADQPSFLQALGQALDGGRAFCVPECDGPLPRLCGGIIVSPPENRIDWFAVASAHRARGLGRALLEFAVRRLDSARDMTVQTFSSSVPEGAAARRLYLSVGFRDRREAEPTPAAIPTVVMVRPGCAG